MNITTYHIQTAMGNLSKFGDSLDFLNTNELDEFNSIGYSGKTTKGEKISREQYLNSLGKGVFKVELTKSDSGTFVEKFTIVRVN